MTTVIYAPKAGLEQTVMRCDACAQGWTGDDCDTCLTGWTGDDCDTCADGWLPPTCDQICDGFGCCDQGDCQGCIQNGRWEGTVGAESLEVHLTFRGDTCTQVVPGELNSKHYKHNIIVADIQRVR